MQCMHFNGQFTFEDQIATSKLVEKEVGLKRRTVSDWFTIYSRRISDGNNTNEFSSLKYETNGSDTRVLRLGVREYVTNSKSTLLWLDKVMQFSIAFSLMKVCLQQMNKSLLSIKWSSGVGRNNRIYYLRLDTFTIVRKSVDGRVQCRFGLICLLRFGSGSLIYYYSPHDFRKLQSLGLIHHFVRL